MVGSRRPSAEVGARGALAGKDGGGRTDPGRLLDVLSGQSGPLGVRRLVGNLILSSRPRDDDPVIWPAAARGYRLWG